MSSAARLARGARPLAASRIADSSSAGLHRAPRSSRRRLSASGAIARPRGLDDPAPRRFRDASEPDRETSTSRTSSLGSFRDRDVLATRVNTRPRRSPTGVGECRNAGSRPLGARIANGPAERRGRARPRRTRRESALDQWGPKKRGLGKILFPRLNMGRNDRGRRPRRAERTAKHVSAEKGDQYLRRGDTEVVCRKQPEIT